MNRFMLSVRQLTSNTRKNLLFDNFDHVQVLHIKHTTNKLNIGQFLTTHNKYLDGHESGLQSKNMDLSFKR